MFLMRLATLATLFGMASIECVNDQAWAQASKRSEERSSEASRRPLRPANSDAPLPEGWPDATSPGTVEIKNYPAYRSAMALATGVSIRAETGLLNALFDHITGSKIDMTAPIVTTYLDPAIIEFPQAKGNVTMELLYRNLHQGRPGNGIGSVVVLDHPGKTFVCLGVVGKMDDKVLRDSVNKLNDWLDQPEHKQKWLEAGPPRRLGYHGPKTAPADRRWEVQIPIEPVTVAKGTAADRKGDGVANGPDPGL